MIEREREKKERNSFAGEKEEKKARRAASLGKFDQFIIDQT